MDKHAARSRDILACLGDSSRFRLALSLLERERCVTELAVAVGLSQSCTTRHLQYLEREGLVRGVRQGRRVVFRLRSDQARVRELLAWATAATPDALARRLSGGDVHADGGGESSVPGVDRPRRRTTRPMAAVPRLPAGPAAPDPAPEIARPETAMPDPEPGGRTVTPQAEAGPSRNDHEAAAPGVKSPEMEDWLL